MERKAFSLMEMLIILIVVSIISTIAFPTYRNFIEDSHARVCETNLRALKTALDIYAMDHDTMPGALGAIPQEYIEKAYAQVMERKDTWKTKLAYSILEWNERGLAYAADPNFLYILAKGHLRAITCPNSDYPPYVYDGDKINQPSYGMFNIISMLSSVYRNLPENTIVIADCNTSILGILTKRHRHVFSGVQYAIGITRDGTIVHDPAD